MHIFYILTLSVYIDVTYLEEEYGYKPPDDEINFYPIIMIVGISYPFCYDTI